MKRLFFIILLILCALISSAQGRFSSLRGRVTEGGGAPVTYASVALISDGRAITGTITDTTGVFVIKGQAAGIYTLKISYIGYDDIEKRVDCAKGGDTDLGNIVLSQDENILDGAMVTGGAYPKNVSVEKTSINPSASISTATGSVLDLVCTASAVSVDGEDKVSIRGNSNVLILVDGVPTALGGLGAIPAANVKSIDIVTSPDVRYDSEGTAGIISIVSRKQAAGSFNAMASFNYGFLGFLNGNLAMSINTGRWGIRLNYSGKYEKDLIESSMHRQLKSGGNIIDQSILATKRTSNQTAGVNLMFRATEKDILSLDFKAIFPRMNNFQNFDNHYVTGGLPSTLFRQTDITFNRETFEGSLGYRHVFDPGKKELSISGSVSKITGHRPSYYYEEGQMVQKSESGGHPLNTSLQVDYLTALGMGKLETGLKMTCRQNNIDHKMFELDKGTGEWVKSTVLSNDLRHREYIPAAYAMYSSKFAPSLSFKAGVRLEYSYVTLHSVKEMLDDHNDCWFVAPNFMLGWRISDSWNLALALSRRISRPTYPQLNPYINLIDNQTYETGNMRLRPEKANKIDLGCSFAGGKVSIDGTAYFSYIRDYINQVAGIRDDILTMTYINGSHDLKAGVNHEIRLRLLKWFSMDISTDTFYTDSRGSFEDADIGNSGWVDNSSIGLDFKPVKGMDIQAQYFVITPQHFPQFTTKTIHYGNIGISQAFLKGALKVSAMATDVFNTRRWDISSDNSVYSLVNDSKNRSRMIWLGISYNFNSYKPLKGAVRRQEDDRSVIRLGD